jgi:hypothetical protein
MLSFSLCNKKRLAISHMNRPLFPTTLSMLSYDIGKWVRLRTYHHPLVVGFLVLVSFEIYIISAGKQVSDSFIVREERRVNTTCSFIIKNK